MTPYDSSKNVWQNLRLDRSYRIIVNYQGSTPRFGLIEVTQDPENKIENPVGWFDGMVIGGKLFRNALLTDHYGNLLSSEYFDVEDKKFIKKHDDWYNYEYDDYLIQDNKGKEFGIIVLFVKSTTESNAHSNVLVELSVTNPHFIHSELDSHYSSQLRNGFLDGISVDSTASQRYNLLSSRHVYKLHSLKTKEKKIYTISKDEAINIIENLFLHRKKFKGSKNFDIYILDLLGRLNVMHDPNSKSVDFDSYRDTNDIEQIITELYRNEPDKSKIWEEFLFKDKSSREDLGDTNIKMWMHKLYLKITSYTGNNPFIHNAKLKLEKIDPLTNPESGIFDDQNLENGIEIFKVIQKLFGHFTIRLILMGMMNWYEVNGNIKIAVNTRLDWSSMIRAVNRFSIIPKSQTKKLLLLSGYAGLSPYQLFTLLFSDLHMFLPTGNINKLTENAFFFGISPVMEDINKLLTERRFAKYYYEYKSKNPRNKQYLDSCAVLYGIIEDIIEKQVVFDYRFGLISSQIIQELKYLARKQIYSKTGQLRLKIETFINSLVYSSDQFHKTKIYIDFQSSELLKSLNLQEILGKKRPRYRLVLTKDLLQGKNIKIWGNVPIDVLDNKKLAKFLYETTWDPSEKQIWERWLEELERYK